MNDTLLELDKTPASSLSNSYPYSEIFNQLIEDYKDKVEEGQNASEIYKWKLIKDFQIKWDDDAEDFQKMLESINFSNLVYGIGLGVLKHITREYPEEVRKCFKLLYDESLLLQLRIEDFQYKIRDLYDKVGVVDLPTHQDERSIATYLAFRYPEKYTLYKWSFYYQLCKALNIKEEATGKKYCHYLDIVKGFVDNCINTDTELLQLKEGFLTDGCHPDPNNMILAQDILYQMLDQTSRCSYWKIGSTAGRNGNSIWPEMKQNSFVSIGWGDLGDLNTWDSLTKAGLATELQSRGHYDKKGVASRKAGEILDFYQNIKPGDVVAVCEGETALAITRVDGDYEFNQDLGFPHYRSVEWLTEPKDFKISDGPHTSVYKIKNPLTIASIERMINNPILKSKTEESAVVPDLASKNIILYGPPGTGKTYNTITNALEILGVDTNGKSRKELKKQFDDRVTTGQIVFTTFHQSMSYEDFIEGIKPIEPEKEGDPVIYKVEEGIFRRVCIEASFSLAKENDSTETGNVLDFSLAYDNLIQELEESLASEGTTQLDTKKGGQIIVDGITPQGNIVVKHPGGSRTYIVSKSRISTLQKSITDLDEVSNIDNQFRAVIGGHNSSAYWAVLNAIRSSKATALVKTEKERDYTWDEKKEVVRSLKREDFKNSKAKPYVLIIDEINRGNVSQIFGELITLIEEDKRLGKDEQLEVTLPYSKEKFGVPANLYIIGAMNTADRSVEALDTALRRRFSFVEMPPRYDLEELQQEVEGYKLADILQKINRRIEKLLGKDNLIGHSYFLFVNDAEGLRAAFQNKIIPLLQEYFYGDYGKIGLVLGEGFFKELDKVEEEDVFATFGNYDPAGLAEKQVYHLAELIGTSRLSDEDFKIALAKLIK